jgi:hypothetical protein
MKRRDFIKYNMIAVPVIGAGLRSPGGAIPEKNKDLTNEGFVKIFDGETLAGWHKESRLPMPRVPGGPAPDKESANYKKALTSKGLWIVEEGAIVGGQDPPGSGLGGYLVSDKEYGDFELMIDIKPDWPVDTGVLIRAAREGVPGIQVLVDHRKSGGIGGFYGNGLGGYHALPYAFDVKRDKDGKAIGLVSESPKTTNEPVTEEKKKLLAYAAPVDEFLSIWKWEDFNTFKIRCEGKYAYLTTWINGIKICELDTAKIVHPGYYREDIFKRFGSKGYISFEVHDNDPLIGKERWWPGAVCRWKNIYIKELG